MRKTALDKLDAAIVALQEQGQTPENRKEFWESVTDYWCEQAAKVGMRYSRTYREPTQDSE